MKCQICEKPLSKKQKLFCSKSCANRRNLQGQERTCKKCGKSFYISPSQIDRYGDYCSMSCSRGLPTTTKKCEYCDKEFVCVSRRQIESKRYCSQDCKSAAQNANIEVKCCVCGKMIPRSPSHAARTQKHVCSPKCFSESISGENSAQWKGGVGSYRGPDWWKIRLIVRQRDNFTCQHCGATEDECGQLDVHHIKPYRLFDTWKEANDLNNLVSLCRSCHSRAENSMRK